MSELQKLDFKKIISQYIFGEQHQSDNSLLISILRDIYNNITKYQISSSTEFKKLDFNINKIKDKKLSQSYLRFANLEQIKEKLDRDLLKIFKENEEWQEIRISKIKEIENLHFHKSDFPQREFIDTKITELRQEMDTINNHLKYLADKFSEMDKERMIKFNLIKNIKYRHIKRREIKLERIHDKVKHKMYQQFIFIKCKKCQNDKSCDTCKGTNKYYIFKSKNCDKCKEGADSKGNFCGACLYGQIYYMD